MKFEKEILEKVNKIIERQNEYRQLMDQYYQLTDQPEVKRRSIPHEIKQAVIIEHALEKIDEHYSERTAFWKEEVERELKRQKNNSCANMSQ